MSNLKLEFTAEEAKVALTLWEVALKQVGDQAVDAYMVLRNKLMAAAKAVEEPAKDLPTAQGE